jgi:hypothetical protein
MKLKILAHNHNSAVLRIELKDANRDFCNTFERIDLLPKLPKEYEYALNTSLKLGMKNVPPHIDYAYFDDGLEHRGAVFGIADGYAWLHVGSEALLLREGDWVMFDDRLMHSVQSDKKWRGVAVQIVKKRNKK